MPTLSYTVLVLFLSHTRRCSVTPDCLRKANTITPGLTFFIPISTRSWMSSIIFIIGLRASAGLMWGHNLHLKGKRLAYSSKLFLEHHQSSISFPDFVFSVVRDCILCLDNFGDTLSIVYTAWEPADLTDKKIQCVGTPYKIWGWSHSVSVEFLSPEIK